MPGSNIRGKKIFLGACGSIAAYKSAELVRLLKKEGLDVTVGLTSSAEQFVTPLTLEILSGNKVIKGFFDNEDKMVHISLAKENDLIVIAPATADFVARVANGYASDILSAVVMSSPAPVLIAPAMNTEMLESESFSRNLEKVKSFGHFIIEPEEGELACGDAGKGRLAGIAAIKDEIIHHLTKRDSFKGKNVLLSYGPTVEKIDDMRFISNRSSGLMGYELARELELRGANVIAVVGPCNYTNIGRSKVIKVESTAEMQKALEKEFKNCDILIMAAAVSDYSLGKPSGGKIKRTDGELTLKLKPTPDILKSLAAKKGGKKIIGFAAESYDLLKNANEKLADKNLDMIVANPITGNTGPGSEFNEMYIIKPGNQPLHIPKATKKQIARQILDNILL